MPGVFISYRREDCPGHAGRIFDRLRSRFGSDVVFMDVAAIEAGVDFVDVLHKAVGSCDALLAVIGPQWLSATHEGKRRLDDPHDFVRIEIAGALERNVRVLPVLVEGASVPSSDALPADLQGLSRRQAVELRDARWDDDIDRLVQGLEKFLPASAPAMPPKDVPGPRGTGDGSIRPVERASSRRGMAIGAIAAVILIVAAAFAWRSGSGSASKSDAAADAPKPAAADARGPTAASTPVAQPAIAPASNAAAPPAAGSKLPPGLTQPTVPPSPRATGSASRASTIGAVPDVTGKTILDAREILRTAGVRFLIRLHDNKSQAPGMVEAQTLDESTGPDQPRRVILTANAISIVSVHVSPSDVQKGDDLVAYLKDQPSTVGSIVRTVPQPTRPEGQGSIGYSEDRLAAQAREVAREVSEYLARTGARPMKAELRANVARGSIVVGLSQGGR